MAHGCGRRIQIGRYLARGVRFWSAILRSGTPRLTAARSSRIMRPCPNPRPCGASRATRQRAATSININFRMCIRRSATRYSGNEFVYYVSADRKTMFPIRIFVRREALDQWTKQTGRALTGTEEYAIAKMRLFQALDDVADFATSRPELTVDESNLQELTRSPGSVIPHRTISWKTSEPKTHDRRLAK